MPIGQARRRTAPVSDSHPRAMPIGQARRARWRPCPIHIRGRCQSARRGEPDGAGVRFTSAGDANRPRAASDSARVRFTSVADANRHIVLPGAAGVRFASVCRGRAGAGPVPIRRSGQAVQGRRCALRRLARAGPFGCPAASIPGGCRPPPRMAAAGRRGRARLVAGQRRPATPAPPAVATRGGAAPTRSGTTLTSLARGSPLRVTQRKVPRKRMARLATCEVERPSR